MKKSFITFICSLYFFQTAISGNVFGKCTHKIAPEDSNINTPLQNTRTTSEPLDRNEPTATQPFLEKCVIPPLAQISESLDRNIKTSNAPPRKKIKNTTESSNPNLETIIDFVKYQNIKLKINKNNEIQKLEFLFISDEIKSFIHKEFTTMKKRIFDDVTLLFKKGRGKYLSQSDKDEISAVLFANINADEKKFKNINFCYQFLNSNQYAPFLENFIIPQDSDIDVILNCIKINDIIYENLILYIQNIFAIYNISVVDNTSSYIHFLKGNQDNIAYRIEAKILEIECIKVIDIDSYLTLTQDKYKHLLINNRVELYLKFATEILDPMPVKWEIISPQKKVFLLDTNENFAENYKSYLYPIIRQMTQNVTGRHSLINLLIAHEFLAAKIPHFNFILTASPKNDVNASWLALTLYLGPDSLNYNRCWTLGKRRTFCESTLSESNILFQENNRATHRIFGAKAFFYDLEEYLKNDFFRNLLYPNFFKIQKQIRKILPQKYKLRELEELRRNLKVFSENPWCKNLLDRAQDLDSIAFAITWLITEKATGSAEDINNILGIHFSFHAPIDHSRPFYYCDDLIYLYVNKISDFDFAISDKSPIRFLHMPPLDKNTPHFKTISGILNIFNDEKLQKIREYIENFFHAPNIMYPDENALKILFKLHDVDYDEYINTQVAEQAEGEPPLV